MIREDCFLEELNHFLFEELLALNHLFSELSQLGLNLAHLPNELRPRLNVLGFLLFYLPSYFLESLLM